MNAGMAKAAAASKPDLNEARRLAEQLVSSLFKSGSQVHALAEVVSRLRQSGVSDADIKAALWRLHAKGEIELTPEWKFRSL